MEILGKDNPFKYKVHCYDYETGLYLIPTTSGSRYYSPAMKSFISPCNIDEILINIDVHGNLKYYSTGSPLYFPANNLIFLKEYL